MNIRRKLLLLIIAGLSLCSLTIISIDRIVAKREIQNITKTNLKDLVRTTHNFIKTHDATDVDKLAAILNKDSPIGNTGFIFILNSKGDMVVHKKVQGENWMTKPFIQHITKTKSGYHRYISPKTKTYKVAAYEYYEPNDWIIVASNFEDDALAEPLKKMLLRSILFLLPVLILIVSGTCYLVRSSIIQPIRRTISALHDGATKVSSSAGQISGSSQSLAEGASQQAASIEETSSSLEEMSSMTKQNSQNAKSADALMKETNQVVGQANDSMNHLTTSMAEISSASEETSKIIKTIDEIAFQTNLLALNAAVEAARAGEAGAGFAVVADEVRNLAMRAADAAKNTTTLLESTVRKVGEGSELVTETNEAFQRVTLNASKVGEIVGEIAAASVQQSTGIEQVNQAVTEMNGAVQHNAAHAEESTAVAHEMNTQANEMESLVANLTVLVGSCVKKQGHEAAKVERANQHLLKNGGMVAAMPSREVGLTHANML